MAELSPLTRIPSIGRLMARSLKPGRRPRDLDGLPEIHLDGLQLDGERVEAFRKLCGFEDEPGKPSAVPLPYLFVSAFDAQLALFTDSRFPLKALGMVHVSNTFQWLGQPLSAGEPFSLRVRAFDLEKVEKGRQVKAEALFLRGDQPVARSVSTSFARGGGHGQAGEPKGRSGPPEREADAEWNLQSDTGRRYAKVSGDYNPIHLYGWSAKLLGFRQPIAHGMYLVSRAVAETLQGVDSDEPFNHLEIRFKTPTFLPSRPKLFIRSGEDSGGNASFELWNHKLNRPHVTGTLSRS